VLIVEPGPFRTDFYGSSLRTTPTPISAYAATSGSRRARLQASHGRQDGDPRRAAEVIVRTAMMANAPLRLPLGKDSVRWLRAKYSSCLAALDESEAEAAATDFRAQ